MDAPTDSTPPSRSGRQPAVTVENLVKRYGSLLAVDDVSFSIREGEIFGIIGPNGAGKTTTVECISGLRVPDSGSISIYGLSPQRDRDRIREFVGVQLQESALPPRLKVGEALELFASFYSSPLDPQEVLESLGINHIERVAFKKLSGGQKQRVSIALALVGNPKIAILDELTTGLDPEARRETWALIERMRGRGVTVILVTHFMDEAETLCDRVALINQGRLPSAGHSGSDRRRGRRDQGALCPIPTRGRQDPVRRRWRAGGGAKGPLCDGHGYRGSGRIGHQCARGRESPGVGARGQTRKP
jgi:ABC-type multidrug transport system ATPase subunit